MSETTLGLPWPWKMKRHLIRGDRFYFFAVSPCTFAIGGELLRDGFVLFLGPFNIGWASISSFERRAAEAEGAPMTDPIILQCDREANIAAKFGEQFRAEQAASYGCSGNIECTYPMDGNCYCFNVTLARHRQAAEADALERAAKVADGHSEARRIASANAIALKMRQEARDHQSMAIEGVHIATAIRQLGTGEGPR